MPQLWRVLILQQMYYLHSKTSPWGYALQNVGRTLSVWLKFRPSKSPDMALKKKIMLLLIPWEWTFRNMQLSDEVLVCWKQYWPNIEQRGDSTCPIDLVVCEKCKCLFHFCPEHGYLVQLCLHSVGLHQDPAWYMHVYVCIKVRSNNTRYCQVTFIYGPFCHLGWHTLVLKCNKNNYDYFKVLIKKIMLLYIYI